MGQFTPPYTYRFAPLRDGRGPAALVRTRYGPNILHIVTNYWPGPLNSGAGIEAQIIVAPPFSSSESNLS